MRVRVSDDGAGGASNDGGTGLVGLGVDLFNGVEPDPIPPDAFTAMMAFGFTLGFFAWRCTTRGPDFVQSPASQ